MVVWVVLTVSLWLSAVALLRGVLLLAIRLLLTRALLILSLLLTVLRVSWTHTKGVGNLFFHMDWDSFG